MEFFAIFVIASQTVFILPADGQNNEDWGNLLKLGQAEQEESLNPNVELQNPNVEPPNVELQNPNVEPPKISGEEIACRAPGKKRRVELAEYRAGAEQRRVELFAKRRKAFEENQQKREKETIADRIYMRQQRTQNKEDKIQAIILKQSMDEQRIRTNEEMSETLKESTIRQLGETVRMKIENIVNDYEVRERIYEERNRISDEERQKRIKEYNDYQYLKEAQKQWQSGEASTAAGSNQNQTHPVPAQGSRAAAFNPNLTIRFPFDIPDPAEGSSSPGLNRNPTYPFPSHSVVPQFSLDSYSGPFAPLPPPPFPSHSFVSQFPFSFYSGPFAPQLPQPTQYSKGATPTPTTLDLLGGFGNQTEYDLPKDRPTTLDLLGTFGNQTDTNY